MYRSTPFFTCTFGGTNNWYHMLYIYHIQKIENPHNLYSFLSKKSKSVIRVLKYDIYFQICERIYLDIVKFYHFLEYYFRISLMF